MTADIQIKDVTRMFGTFTALDRVDLKIAAGKFAVLLGPSGCGKTTLLSILGGFLQPSSGRVMIGGNDVTDVPPAKRPSTTMFQDYALFPHMTLGDNVGFGLRMRGIGKRDRHRKSGEMLSLVGLDDAFGKKPHELSGGQRQRVALARALAVDPDLLLLDEPLGALDLNLRRQMQDELKAIQKRVGTTFVHVTHDQEEAMAIADEIIVMNHGRIQDMGPPDAIYLRPKNHFTAAFMGEANFLEGTIVRLTDNEVSIDGQFGRMALKPSARADNSLQAGDAVKLCFRPEHLRSGPAEAGIINLGDGLVRDVAFSGTHQKCHVAPNMSPTEIFTVHLPQKTSLAIGESIPLNIAADNLIILRGNEVQP